MKRRLRLTVRIHIQRAFYPLDKELLKELYTSETTLAQKIVLTPLDNEFALKELYTSQTAFAQKIVLTPLNNEFRLKNLYSTSFMLKDLPEFLKKIYKNQFLASGRGLMVFIHIYKVV